MVSYLYPPVTVRATVFILVDDWLAWAVYLGTAVQDHRLTTPNWAFPLAVPRIQDRASFWGCIS